MSDPQAPMRTRPVRVKVFLRNGCIVEGEVQVETRTYNRRISDVLNISPPNFLPIVDAVYELSGERERAETVLVNTSDIVMVHAGGEEATSVGERDRTLPGTAL
ncbi:MAG: hypothetical protein M3133_03430 [Actinomycetota bacterium]|nr:hypothetical protein [Actinomycetota bacterium]